MRQIRTAGTWIVAAAALGLALHAGQAETATAGEIRGVWTAERSKWRVEKGETATIVQLSLQRVGGRGNWNSSHSVPLSELEGLMAAAIDAPSSDVRFAWKRDAGAFALEGSFKGGAGAGHFSFVPNPAYVAEMRSRGYADIDDEKALALAIHDVSRAFVAELATLGYDRVPMDKLLVLRIHGASPEFIRGLVGLGYKQLPVDQIIAFRIHGVSPEFVRAFRGMGYDRLTADQLVAMRIHGVSAEFVTQLKGLGYSGVPVDELVNLRIHGVSPEYIRRVQGRAGKSVTVDRLVSMRIHGEDPD